MLTRQRCLFASALSQTRPTFKLRTTTERNEEGTKRCLLNFYNIYLQYVIIWFGTVCHHLNWTLPHNLVRFVRCWRRWIIPERSGGRGAQRSICDSVGLKAQGIFCRERERERKVNSRVSKAETSDRGGHTASKLALVVIFLSVDAQMKWFRPANELCPDGSCFVSNIKRNGKNRVSLPICKNAKFKWQPNPATETEDRRRIAVRLSLEGGLSL